MAKALISMPDVKALLSVTKKLCLKQWSIRVLIPVTLRIFSKNCQFMANMRQAKLISKSLIFLSQKIICVLNNLSVHGIHKPSKISYKRGHPTIINSISILCRYIAKALISMPDVKAIFSVTKKNKFVPKTMENPGIDPGTSHMLSERSTT